MDEGQTPRLVAGIQHLAKRQHFVGRDGAADLDREGVLNAAKIFDVRSVEGARAVPDPGKMGAEIVPAGAPRHLPRLRQVFQERVSQARQNRKRRSAPRDAVPMVTSLDILRPSVTFLLYMKTATLRQLRHDFGAVLTWVEQGEAVEISKRGRIIALLSPPLAPKPARPKKRPHRALEAHLRRPGVVGQHRGRRSRVAALLIRPTTSPIPPGHDFGGASSTSP